MASVHCVQTEARLPMRCFLNPHNIQTNAPFSLALPSSLSSTLSILCIVLLLLQCNWNSNLHAKSFYWTFRWFNIVRRAAKIHASEWHYAVIHGKNETEIATTC